MRLTALTIVWAIALTSAQVRIPGPGGAPVSGGGGGGGGPVTILSHTEIIDTDANNSITVTVPSGLASGDTWLIIVIADVDSGASLSTPTGFSLIGDYTGSVGWPIVGCYYKTAGVSESSVNVTVTGNDYDAVAYSIRLSPSSIDAVGIVNIPGSGGTNLSAPSITVGADNSLAILLFASEGDVATLTNPSGTTLLDSRTGSVFPVGGVAYVERNAGLYSPGSWSMSWDVGLIGQTFSFRP